MEGDNVQDITYLNQQSIDNVSDVHVRWDKEHDCYHAHLQYREPLDIDNIEIKYEEMCNQLDYFKVKYDNLKLVVMQF